MAMALGIPARFLVGQPVSTVAEQDVHFRRLRSTSKRDRVTALARLSLLSQLVERIDRSVELPEVDLPIVIEGQSPREAAAQLRAEWGLGGGPIASIARLLERHGVIVVRLHDVSADVDAFSCWFRGRPYVALIGDKGDIARSRFDAAHELGHLLLHHDAHPGDMALEREAHAFAAALLMPDAVIYDELPARVDWRLMLALKLRWGVSMAALLRRARDVGRISESSYKRGMMMMSRYRWRRSEPGDLQHIEEPSMVFRALDLMAADPDETSLLEGLGWNESVLSDVIGPRMRRPLLVP
jgi:Zn-dependent peptidase ImmA (M78 family)